MGEGGGGGGGLPQQPPALQGWETGKGHSAEQLHPVSWAHSSRARGEKAKKKKKEKKEAVSEAFTCWSRFSARRCVLSETIKATADSSGVKRSSSNPPTTAATTLHFCCPCEISLDGFNDLWMSAFSVTLTLVADTSGWQGVMHCVEVLLRCNF